MNEEMMAWMALLAERIRRGQMTIEQVETRLKGKSYEQAHCCSTVLEAAALLPDSDR